MRSSIYLKNNFKSQIKIYNHYSLLIKKAHSGGASPKKIKKASPNKARSGEAIPKEIDYLLDYLYLCVINNKDPLIHLISI